MNNKRHCKLKQNEPAFVLVELFGGCGSSKQQSIPLSGSSSHGSGPPNSGKSESVRAGVAATFPCASTTSAAAESSMVVRFWGGIGVVGSGGIMGGFGDADADAWAASPAHGLMRVMP